jgi:predicted TIM-barrel fold metal-dependent hydrolase
MRKAKARGFKGVILASWPTAGDIISAADDSFWAACVDEGMSIAIHIFMMGRAARIATRVAAVASGGPGYYKGKGQADSATRGKAIGGLANLFGTVPDTISQFIFSGVFERYPALQVALIETGVGWIPHFLEAMDDRYWRNRGWGGVELSEPPSHYWYQNMAASYVSDPVGIRLRNEVGIDNVMWSSDYPHHVNDWPYSRKFINLTLGPCSADERTKIVGGNAARIFGI